MSDIKLFESKKVRTQFDAEKELCLHGVRHQELRKGCTTMVIEMILGCVNPLEMLLEFKKRRAGQVAQEHISLQ